MVGDLASTYLGLARGVDPTPIEAIARLKRRSHERCPRLPAPADTFAERSPRRSASARRSSRWSVVLGAGSAPRCPPPRGRAAVLLRGAPRVPAPTVPGHAGRLWLGTSGTRVAVFQGRIHFYEGHGLALASLPSRVAAGSGPRDVLTAAAGSVDLDIGPSRRGAPITSTSWGRTRSADGGAPTARRRSSTCRGLRPGARGSRARGGATELEGTDRGSRPRGVYAALPGPLYETPAETGCCAQLGAAVVGMSVVPEAVAARALGMRVLGLSFATNRRRAGLARGRPGRVEGRRRAMAGSSGARDRF